MRAGGSITYKHEKKKDLNEQKHMQNASTKKRQKNKTNITSTAVESARIRSLLSTINCIILLVSLDKKGRDWLTRGAMSKERPVPFM
jgi:hypothetical protein